MTAAVIITFCVLLLFAYFFDITSPKTKIPSVVLLLFSGWLVQQLSAVFNFRIPDLTPILPILGTIGLILIVLEGSLELELNRSKIRTVKNSLIISLLSVLILTFVFGYGFHYFSGYPLKICMINSIPLCIISSAIAISSARNLAQLSREFVTYESSLSDIFGVLLFNFLIVNEVINGNAIGLFSVQVLLILIISFAATLGLAFLLNRINHRIKFAPIILLIVLIYEISKVYHLPSLLFILLFGLIMGNVDELKQLKFMQRLNPGNLNREIHKFRELVVEATFIVRSVFFLLFGYLIQTSEILDSQNFFLALAIVSGVFVIRYLLLKLLSLEINPLLFFAPRGLITILLFLAIPDQERIPLINRSLVIQVIILSAFAMMLGSVLFKKKNDEEAEQTTENKTT
jgi:potassium/hydrogen antiporter